MKAIYIPFLYFPNCFFFFFLIICCHFHYLLLLTSDEGDLTGLNASTNAIYQTEEITLQGLFSEFHWINNIKLLKHVCLLSTSSKWFDYLFTEIMTQDADCGFNFIWLMDLDFNCTLSIYVYPATDQLPHWYAVFYVCVPHLKSRDDKVE